MGYLINDNRESGGKLFESDTVSCGHCQAVVLVTHRQVAGGYCSECDKPVCAGCAVRMAITGCEQWSRQVEIALGGKPRQIWRMYQAVPAFPRTPLWFAPLDKG